MMFHYSVILKNHLSIQIIRLKTTNMMVKYKLYNRYEEMSEFNMS